MVMSLSCRYWMLTAVWFVAMAACLGAFEVDTELDLTDNEYSDVEGKFQDLLVDRRSLNLYQSSSVEGENLELEFSIRNISRSMIYSVLRKGGYPAEVGSHKRHAIYPSLPN